MSYSLHPEAESDLRDAFDKSASSKPSYSTTTANTGRAERRQNLKTIKEIETDQISFVGVPVVINGVIELSSYYNCGYRDTQPSYFAFRLFDRSGILAEL
jgi:hypothetical protein